MGRRDPSPLLFTEIDPGVAYYDSTRAWRNGPLRAYRTADTSSKTAAPKPGPASDRS
jgi:hypothetical protein